MSWKELAEAVGVGAVAGLLAIALGYLVTMMIFWTDGQGVRWNLTGHTRPLAGDAVATRAPALSPAWWAPVHSPRGLARNAACSPSGDAAPTGPDFFGEIPRRGSAAVHTDAHNESDGAPGSSRIGSRSKGLILSQAGPAGWAAVAWRGAAVAPAVSITKNARCANTGRRMHLDELTNTSEARRMYQITPQGAMKSGTARYRAMAAWHADMNMPAMRRAFTAAPHFPLIRCADRVERGGTGMRTAPVARHGGGGPDHAA